MAETLAQQYPGLRLAYDQVKGVLESQALASDALDNKASSMLAVGTAVFGLGVSLGLARLFDTPLPAWAYITIFFLAAAPLALYVALWVLARNVMGLRPFVSLDNPEGIRTSYWELPPDQFIHDILVHTEEAWKDNEGQLKEKTEAMRRLFTVTFVGTIAVVGWLSAVLLVTLVS